MKNLNDLRASVKAMKSTDNATNKFTKTLATTAPLMFKQGLTPEVIGTSLKTAKGNNELLDIVVQVETVIAEEYFTKAEAGHYLAQHTDKGSRAYEKDSTPFNNYKKVSKGMSQYKKRLSGAIKKVLIEQGIMTDDAPIKDEWTKVTESMKTLFNRLHNEDLQFPKGINANMAFKLCMELNDTINGYDKH